ncbi:DNA-binding winged helix-turn-helix (wHTH) protein [Paraburkholderia youngii]|uniref:winged helix-turn-helix domain-containing protein n=1 Tax=Paraburkholderia youngii TaxID=2782701 RepID=UPI003D2348A5
MSPDKRPSDNVECKMTFSLDTRTLGNISSGARTFLSRNQARLLELLFEGPRTKEVLMSRIWGDQGVIVSDASYYQLVAQLRHAFEMIGLPRLWIRTIPRYGLELAVGGKHPAHYGSPRAPEVIDTRLVKKPLSAIKIGHCSGRCALHFECSNVELQETGPARRDVAPICLDNRSAIQSEK